MAKNKPKSQGSLTVVPKTQAALSRYPTQKMYCPVQGANIICIFVPLAHMSIHRLNPGRCGGTQTQNINAIFHHLVTSPIGQEEPICLEYNQNTGLFDLVYGFNRQRAADLAANKGLNIAGTPGHTPGLWAWHFAGTEAQKVGYQARENGNKPPGSPATLVQMVHLTKKWIDAGGPDADLDGTSYATSFEVADDAEKKRRCRAWMKVMVPPWSGTKFEQIWSRILRDPAMPTHFKTHSKASVCKYFCNNNPYGVQVADFDLKRPSGTVVKRNGKKYAFYFAGTSAEISGALPTNAAKCLVKKEVDVLVVVVTLNDVSAPSLVQKRANFVLQAEYFNSLLKTPCFSEFYFVPQTSTEMKAHFVAGTYPKHAKI